jgi:hypothetical protein
MLGQWLKHGGQYPDYQLRLFRRGKAHFPCKHVHEKLRVEGTIGKSPRDLLHHPYPTLDIYIRKFNFYTTFEALVLAEKRRLTLPGLNYLILKPFSRFLKRYILYSGFLDGFGGFAAAFFDMLNFQVRYLKYLEMKRKGCTGKAKQENN